MKTKEEKRAEGLSKKELRLIVGRIRTIDSKKLLKMNRDKLIAIVSTISLIKIRDLLS